ncbi:MAG: TVP38/TMEM64 family protein [Chloroflexi bacterium]|nr:TVP38/TMEM64 family protein [Chloroflexota bacterium]
MNIETRQNAFQRLWAWVKRHRTPVIAVAFWLALIVAVQQYMAANNLSFAQFTAQLQTILSGSWYGPVLYLVIYLLRPIILFPASLLTILGGSVFGLWPGFLYVLIAGTLSALIPYGIGRWFSSGAAQEQTSESTIQRFVRMLRQNPFQAVLIMRLIYLPYDAVSLVAGSLRIPFLLFVLATALGNLAGTLSFVGLGASIEGDLAAGQASINPSVLLFSAVILVVSLAISRLLSRRQQRGPNLAQQESE